VATIYSLINHKKDFKKSMKTHLTMIRAPEWRYLLRDALSKLSSHRAPILRFD